ncbi:MAG: elongation factor G [Coriobacteriales bacterium]|nr:elongation factor G [Coriobacteriales bacterium]
MAADISKVKNLCLVGQDGAGKTSLAEALLFVTGKTSKMGTTADGKSNLDYDEQEIKRQFTINASIAPLKYKDCKVNVLDTSGHPDFIGQTLYSMQASEMAVVVVDASTGPQIMTNKFWRHAQIMNLPRAIFVNHIDCEGANYDQVMADLTSAFGSRLGAVTIPMGVDADFKGVIDIVRMKARVNEGGKEKVSDIPDEFASVANDARDKLVDLVAEADDELMMKYLDGEELTQDELESLLDKAISQEIFIPVYVGSALATQGLEPLLDDAISYFPTADAYTRYKTTDGDDFTIDASGKPGAFVFNTLSDPYVCKLSFVKVVSREILPGTELVNSRTGKKEKCASINEMMGKNLESVKSAGAGDIVVIPKLAEAKTGDTLSEGGAIKLEPFALPQPQYPVAIEAKDRNSEDKLSTFLAKIIETDPTIKLVQNEATHQSVLTCMGETQLDMLIDKAKNQGNVEVNLVAVKIPYQETITKECSAQGRHKKQSGGAGQFGDCFLRLMPNAGNGYEFIDEIKGGAIPGSLIPAVDKGVVETMRDGFLAGYPMVDVKVAVFDGSFHPVDSNEISFKSAARIAFKAACEQGNPVILEPYARIDVTVSDEYFGAIMGDVSTKRGSVIGQDTNEFGEMIIKARVPYAEVIEYQRDLRQMTRGSGSFTLEMDGYEQVPGDVQKKLVDEYQAARAAASA